MQLSKIKFKDVINPIKWWSFISGLIIGRFMKVHILEQMIVRIKDEECRTCVKNGSCHHCGCSMPERAWVFSETCSNGNWGPIMNKKEWEAHKKKYGITIKIERNV